MNYFIKSLSVALIFLTATISFGQQQTTENQRTWTLTYLKANKGQKANLKLFLEQNWLAMDKIAVNQGLFNDYELIENTVEDDKQTWDFIVTVEYFSKGNYADIAEKFEMIRKEHKTVKVENLGLIELGKVVKSETVTKPSITKTENKCVGKQYEILQPLLGDWDEFSVTEKEQKLFGRLSIKLDTDGCSLTKRFVLYNKTFTYTTHAYFDSKENAWLETFTFNNGNNMKFKWVGGGKDILMEKPSDPTKPNVLSHNRWTNFSKNEFEIIEERSEDEGKTWKVLSVTKLKRK
jgi:uncharacterized protein YfkK (UPF0435 family)